jgi:hypothetical protein
MASSSVPDIKPGHTRRLRLDSGGVVGSARAFGSPPGPALDFKFQDDRIYRPSG